jgi:hypothetical protein
MANDMWGQWGQVNMVKVGPICHYLSLINLIYLILTRAQGPLAIDIALDPAKFLLSLGFLILNQHLAVFKRLRFSVVLSRRTSALYQS